ncbi:MAG TPA: potassium channel protein [Acidimicrobiia bacterium]|nr:potassium channel protein [Acidimicrobiia bacterium]
MNQNRRFLAAVSLLTLISAVGTAGYIIVEDASLLDALYMTLITISTVGFQEVVSLSSAGRVLTIFIIVFGVGATLYTAGTALEIGLERFLGGRWRQRRMERDVSKVDNHVIVCGFGRVGSQVWQALREEGTASVVIEVDTTLATHAAEAGALVIEGDATHDDVLAAAGIDRARSLVACVRSDADNLVIVLSAKTRRPALSIIARASEPAWEAKLKLAGADRVVAPQVVGAQRLAALAGQPQLEEFVDLILHGKLVELRIEEIGVGAGATFAGRPLRDSQIREETGALVLAVEDEHGHLIFNPDPAHRLTPGNTIIGMGNPEQLDHLRQLAGN